MVDFTLLGEAVASTDLRLKREWGFIFRSIKRRGTVQKRIDTRARTG